MCFTFIGGSCGQAVSRGFSARIAAGNSRQDAARHFGVSASFAVKLAQIVAKMGLAAIPHQGRPLG